MTARIAEWWSSLASDRRLDTRWTFEIERFDPASGVAWRWARYDAGRLAARSIGAFPTFMECARDAESNGFSRSHAYQLCERNAAGGAAWARPASPA